MSLTEKQKERVRNMPIVESSVRKSQDGKFLVHKTEINSIKPVQYYEAVIKDAKEAAQ